MSAVALHARPTRDFNTTLHETVSLLRAIVSAHPRATPDAAPAGALGANAIGRVTLCLHEPIATVSYRQSRSLGSLVLVDTASHRTAAAVLLS